MASGVRSFELCKNYGFVVVLLLSVAAVKVGEATFIVNRFVRDTFTVSCGNLSSDPCQYGNAGLESKNSSTCICKCPSYEYSTFANCNNTWKCYKNSVLRTRLQSQVGTRLRFKGELETSNITLFPVGKSISVRLNVTAITNRTCRIDKTTSYHQTCNGTSKIIPLSSLASFEMKSSHDGTLYFLKGNGQYSLLQGRVLRIGINCSSTSSSEKFSVLAKIGGQLTCPGFLPFSAVKSEEETQKQNQSYSTGLPPTIPSRTFSKTPGNKTFTVIITSFSAATGLLIFAMVCLITFWIFRKKRRTYSLSQKKKSNKGPARTRSNSKAIEVSRANFDFETQYEEIDSASRSKKENRDDPVYEEILPAIGESNPLNAVPSDYKSLDRTNSNQHEYQSLKKPTGPQSLGKQIQSEESKCNTCENSGPVKEQSREQLHFVMSTNCNNILKEPYLENDNYVSRNQRPEMHTYLMLELPENFLSAESDSCTKEVIT